MAYLTSYLVSHCWNFGDDKSWSFDPCTCWIIIRGELHRSMVTAMCSWKKELLSATMKRTHEWVSSQEIPSDLTIHVGGVSFPLHKFPLSSKCGYIRKLLAESTEANLQNIELSDVPGGSEAFELVAKFCYGVHFEINVQNVAMLRCVAECLSMTEEYAAGNLVGRAEAYLSNVALQDLSDSVSILRASENLLPLAEKTKMVSHCIDAIAYLACKDTQSSVMSLSRDEGEITTSSDSQLKLDLDWWAEDLTLLKIDFFRRVLVAMMARGFKQYALGPILMMYTEKFLRGLDPFGKVKNKSEPRNEHEKRVVLETIVSLLPKEKNAFPVSFLSKLLRSSIYLETTVACSIDLERRMASQLEQAVLDDLLIPSYSVSGDTLFDVDSVKRIMTNYLGYIVDGDRICFVTGEQYVPPHPSELENVYKLLENYLVEIASDRNLPVSKFTDLAELIPKQSRAMKAGMHRAVEIFLKAHPNTHEMDRKKVFSLIDFQKQSLDDLPQVAQNNQLKVRAVFQSLHKQRVREVMNSEDGEDYYPIIPATFSLDNKMPRSYYTSSQTRLVSDETVALRRKNDDLKIELIKMKMRVKEMDRSSGSSCSIPPYDHKPPVPWKSFMKMVSKRLGLVRGDAKAQTTRPGRARRHSIS